MSDPTADSEPLLGYVTMRFEVREGYVPRTYNGLGEEFLALRNATVVYHSMSADTVEWLVESANDGSLDQNGSRLHEAIVALAVPAPFSVVAAGFVGAEAER